MDGQEENWAQLNRGACLLRARIPRRLLNQRNYRVELLAAIHYRVWLLEPGVNAPFIYFQLQGGLSDSPHYMTRRPTLLAPIIDWQLLNGS